MLTFLKFTLLEFCNLIYVVEYMYLEYIWKNEQNKIEQIEKQRKKLPNLDATWACPLVANPDTIVRSISHQAIYIRTHILLKKKIHTHIPGVNI